MFLKQIITLTPDRGSSRTVAKFVGDITAEQEDKGLQKLRVVTKRIWGLYIVHSPINTLFIKLGNV